MTTPPSDWSGHSWVPTNKWVVATVVGIGSLATAVAVDGGWHDAETFALIALVVQRVASYMTPNSDDD